ncbi:transcriptional regulator BetI [Dongia soli]|uniref:HTH-type transcriptional regulator BetI n=1 Tax=Dongia soli TaxID=600628 RepID=A0ABU5E9D3_9PROT|nr:transcriptional regulator BetI [Dongia soli]MDY0882887.1 transcriptional regulator BetI [Dongia soli]
MRASIESIRRQELIKAAYETFRQYGFRGLTMARIGKQAGMSHGIINYYYKSKEDLLIAMVRYANRLIMEEVIRRLHEADTPLARLDAIIEGNFPAHLYDRATASAWVSFYSAVPEHPEFDRLQTLFYRRLRSNLLDCLASLTTPAEADRLVKGISVMIDGMWMRCAIEKEGLDRSEAVDLIKDFAHRRLGR